MAVSTMVSCVDTSDLETKLEDIEGRISKLEAAAAQVNGYALTVRKFVNEHILIIDFEKLEHGYRLDLSDGTTVTITDGLNAPGIVPIVGIDSEGNWLMSIDNGETFTPVKGATNAFSATGQTPQIKIDEQGFWLVSLDGGKTFEQILGANGKPLSATDGSLTSGKSTFFNNIVYDKEKGLFMMTLATGETLSVPVVESFYIKVAGYTRKAPIFLGQTLTYKVEMADVAGAVFQVPEGWEAVLTNEELQITSPLSAAEGEYTVVAESLGGINVVISPNSKTVINLFDIEVERTKDEITGREREILNIENKVEDVTQAILTMARGSTQSKEVNELFLHVRNIDKLQQKWYIVFILYSKRRS